MFSGLDVYEIGFNNIDLNVWDIFGKSLTIFGYQMFTTSYIHLSSAAPTQADYCITWKEGKHQC